MKEKFKFTLTKAQKGAFTLAETLITLTILGVIAAITVPSLINKQIESANRTKLKKAMTMYEKALNQMIIDNDLKTNDAIKAEFNNDDCATSNKYFKPVETTDSACRFKTADRVWWDISDIENPMISLKNINSNNYYYSTLSEMASDFNDRDIFGMVGYIENDILRINDKAFYNGNMSNMVHLEKLYNFINNENNQYGNEFIFNHFNINVPDSYKNYVTNICGGERDIYVQCIFVYDNMGFTIQTGKVVTKEEEDPENNIYEGDDMDIGFNVENGIITCYDGGIANACEDFGFTDICEKYPTNSHYKCKI